MIVQIVANLVLILTIIVFDYENAHFMLISHASTALAPSHTLPPSSPNEVRDIRGDKELLGFLSISTQIQYMA